ncbi:MAG: hypothetical protein Q9191_000279 [Dirinaria sp. TL-2023a]
MTVPSLTQDVGVSLPPDTQHAVSVSLPTWESCVGYEEGEQWVLSKMKNGYPRFFLDPTITKFAQAIIHKHGSPTQQALLLPSDATAARCVDFFKHQVPALREGTALKAVSFYPRQDSFGNFEKKGERNTRPVVVAVLFPRDHFRIAKTFWQHTGDGISSRRADVCHKAFDAGQLVSCLTPLAGPSKDDEQLCKGPQRYRKQSVKNTSALGTESHRMGNNAKSSEAKDYSQYVEERFGRNMDVKLAASAKLAIRRRIAGALTADMDLDEAVEIEKIKIDGRGIRGVQGLSVDDVYLYPSGMSSIFNTHRTMLKCKGSKKSICFGYIDSYQSSLKAGSADNISFPYIDTLKILEKWGPGCTFYGHGSSDDIDDIERRCQNGETFLALFCEFPGNPLLKSPDIGRLRSLADRYGFAIVIDETIGNFLNVHVLPYGDVVVSSLTKVFSGDSNVMGGRSVTRLEGIQRCC